MKKSKRILYFYDFNCRNNNIYTINDDQNLFKSFIFNIFFDSNSTIYLETFQNVIYLIT